MTGLMGFDVVHVDNIMNIQESTRKEMGSQRYLIQYVFCRVHRKPVQTDFIVKMGAGTQAGIPYGTDGITFFDADTASRFDGMHMGITGDDTMTVINDDYIAK